MPIKHLTVYYLADHKSERIRLWIYTKCALHYIAKYYSLWSGFPDWDQAQSWTIHYSEWRFSIKREIQSSLNPYLGNWHQKWKLKSFSRECIFQPLFQTISPFNYSNIAVYCVYLLITTSVMNHKYLPNSILHILLQSQMICPCPAHKCVQPWQLSEAAQASENVGIDPVLIRFKILIQSLCKKFELFKLGSYNISLGF